MVQLLVASGVKVVGVDMVLDRCRLAEKAGAVPAGLRTAKASPLSKRPAPEPPADAAPTESSLSPGGTSNSPSSWPPGWRATGRPWSTSARCKLDLPWNDYYEKELDVRFSRSLRPGPVRRQLRGEGIDYPIGYVRWTERRNLACFVDLIASSNLTPSRLSRHLSCWPCHATNVYERMKSLGDLRGVGSLFKYDEVTAR